MDNSQITGLKRRTSLNEISQVNSDSFWDMLKYVKSKKWCFQPFCTTCGCMDYRRYLKHIGYDKLSNILQNVTIEELKAQDDLDWHDALEIILLDFGKELVAGTTIQEEYDFVRNKYYELRHTYHYPINIAREKVLTLLKEK